VSGPAVPPGLEKVGRVHAQAPPPEEVVPGPELLHVSSKALSALAGTATPSTGPVTTTTTSKPTLRRPQSGHRRFASASSLRRMALEDILESSEEDSE
jgi:hypothetical protein